MTGIHCNSDLNFRGVAAGRRHRCYWPERSKKRAPRPSGQSKNVKQTVRQFERRVTTTQLQYNYTTIEVPHQQRPGPAVFQQPPSFAVDHRALAADLGHILVYGQGSGGAGPIFFLTMASSSPFPRGKREVQNFPPSRSAAISKPGSIPSKRPRVECHCCRRGCPPIRRRDEIPQAAAWFPARKRIRPSAIGPSGGGGIFLLSGHS